MDPANNAANVDASPLTAQDIDSCLKVLQLAARDPSLMAGNERFKGLVAKVHRHAKKANKSTHRKQAVSADRGLAQQTAIVRQQQGLQQLSDSSQPPSDFQRARTCYICKQPFTHIHAFYHILCPDCARLNWDKRTQRADLRGRVALVTGGRIKIGYQSSLKLLRDGARVLVTTRFPQDAQRRFRMEQDSADWLVRLEVHGLDLRDIPTSEAFARQFLEREAHLDILIHNAAQTIKRPFAYYRHLLEAEAQSTLPGDLTHSPTLSPLLEARPEYKGHLPGTEVYLPPNILDQDGQQVDRRPINSWRLKIGEIGTIELLEVLLVSSVAPFVLTNHLLPALLRSPHTRRFIICVSAMEGQFARQSKTAFHPHTNMAKAALNMLTRTSAADLAQKGIYINSVDTGWITDENPLPQAERIREEHGFYVPLDAIDGAARIYDPIARGMNESAEPLHGNFLKDYAPYPW